MQQLSTLSPQELLKVPQLVSQTRQLKGKCNIHNSQRGCGNNQVLVYTDQNRIGKSPNLSSSNSVEMGLRNNLLASFPGSFH